MTRKLEPNVIGDDLPPADVFSPLLTSDPIPLPFDGAWHRIQVVYNVERVMSLPLTFRPLTADLRERATPLTARLAEIRLLLAPPATEGEPEEAAQLDPAVEDALREERRLLQIEEEAIERASVERVLAHVVTRFIFPYAGAPPVPSDPASWATWPLAVVNWIVGPGMRQASAALFPADPKV